MVIKNLEIQNYMNVFNKLIDCDKFKDVIVQFSIFKIFNQLKTEQSIVNEFRKHLESEFFMMDDNGNIIFDAQTNSPIFKDGKTDKEYLEKLTAILSETFEINTELSISLNDLQPLADAGILVPSDFSVLQSFIKED